MIIKYLSKLILIPILLVGMMVACNLPTASESTPTITSVPTLAISTLPPVTDRPRTVIPDVAVQPNETIETTATATPTPCIPAMPDDWISYVVQPGDTLFSLADERGTTVAELMEVNCRDSTIVSDGDVLFVPQENISEQTTAEPSGQSSTPTVTRVPTENPTSTPGPAPMPSVTWLPPDDPAPKPPR